MPTYTVEIQASDDSREIWQALAPAETVEDDGTAQELAEWVAQSQNVADGPNWRVRVWNGPDADTSTEPAAEYVAPELTTAEYLAETIAQTYVIDLEAALSVVRVHVDQITADADLWNDDRRALTAAGVEVVSTAIAESYSQDLNSSAEDQMLVELEDIVTKRAELETRRDELIRTLMATPAARERIAGAADLKVARLYQIRDGRR